MKSTPEGQQAWRLRRRIEGRKAAEEIRELLDIGRDPTADPYLDAFIETLRPAAKPTNAPPREPIARLGATPLDFGAHRGKTFDDVPVDYLDWLCKSQESSAAALRSYLTHPDLESRRRGLDK